MKNRNKSLVSIFFLCIGSILFSCSEENIGGYECVSGQCQESPDGDFSSLAECEENCSYSYSPGYDCVNGNCEETSFSEYASREDCQNYCSNGSTDSGARFNCFSGNCEESADGEYASFSECENACLAGSMASFNCIDGNCIESANGEFSSLSECQSYCEEETEIGFNCVDGNCIESANGEFSSLGECQNYCVEEVTMGYDCVNGNCLESENGAYSSLSDCQSSCQYEAGCPSTVTDIDGNSYQVVTIGNQCWMMENLKTSRFNDGSELSYNSGIGTTKLWAHYNDNSRNESTFGKLYHYKAVELGNLCPEGWHIPSDDDWEELIDYLGGRYVAGTALKAGWSWEYFSSEVSYNRNMNSSRFSAVAGGHFGGTLYGSSAGPYYSAGQYGYYWTSTKTGRDPYAYTLAYSSQGIEKEYQSEYYYNSCRCVKD